MAALRAQAEPFIKYMMANGPQAALLIIDSLVLPDPVQKVLQQLYGTVGVQSANEEYGHLIKTYPDLINQQKAFGFNRIWRDIMNTIFGRIGAEKVQHITDTEKKRIQAVLERGQDENLSNYELAKLLRSDAVNDARARVIARTETGTAAAEGGQIAADQSGLELAKTWISAQRFNTRRMPRDQFDHLTMHGVQVGPNEPFFVPSKFGGEFLNYPHDANGSAGNVINCRCVVVREPI